MMQLFGNVAHHEDPWEAEDLGGSLFLIVP